MFVNRRIKEERKFEDRKNELFNNMKSSEKEKEKQSSLQVNTQASRKHLRKKTSLTFIQCLFCQGLGTDT